MIYRRLESAEIIQEGDLYSREWIDDPSYPRPADEPKPLDKSFFGMQVIDAALQVGTSCLWRPAPFIPHAGLPLTRHTVQYLDLGVRKLVLWLNRMGLKTTDSGDGSKHAHFSHFLPEPHVYGECEWDKAEYYKATILSHITPKHPQAQVSMSFSFSNSKVFFCVLYVTDDDLTPQQVEQAMDYLKTLPEGSEDDLKGQEPLTSDEG